jgi:hypothetical protein
MSERGLSIPVVEPSVTDPELRAASLAFSRVVSARAGAPIPVTWRFDTQQ